MRPFARSALASLPLLLALSAQAQVHPELFVDAPAAPALNLPPEFIPIRPVTVDIALFQKLTSGSTITLKIDNNTSYTVVIDRAESKRDDSRVVSGFVLEAEGRATFVQYEDAIAMQLHVPSRKEIYRLQFLGGGNFEICRVDDTNEQLCEGGLTPPPTLPHAPDPNDDDFIPEGGNPAEPSGYGGGCTGGVPMIDVWVLYTPAARDADGGDSAIRADGALAVELANESYINSGISQRMRLVRCNLVTYTEGSSLNVDLDRLTGTSDGYMDGIHATRDTINADLVALFTNTGSGLGWCIADHDSGFCCVKYSRATSTYSLAHETGHNMGCAHDRANADCGPAYDYGYGYTWVGNDNNTYSSVMSYGAGRITHFSNPNITYQGVATGVATSSSNSAYNALVINNRDRTVENFELTRWDIYVTAGSTAIPFLGTYSFPYPAFALGVASIASTDTGTVDLPNLYVRGDQTFTGTISKEMTILPCGGAVTIGN